jgi:hypothetical protein
LTVLTPLSFAGTRRVASGACEMCGLGTAGSNCDLIEPGHESLFVQSFFYDDTATTWPSGTEKDGDGKR